MRAEDWVWIAVIALIMVTLMVEGSIYPPANGDSMVYHLARVSHWIQNRSIAPFSTHYLAQVELSPLSEYNLAHLHLLSGTDRFDWSMQWFAALVCIVGASELARLFGASRRTQIAASVICATIPSGVLLAVTTENDYFAAATGVGLLVVLAAYSFRGRWIVRTMALGVAAGLAYLAKGTMPSMIGPVAITLFGLAIYRSLRATKGRITAPNVVGWVAVAGASVAAVVGPFVTQTWLLFGSVIGPTSKSTIGTPVSFASFGANVVRSTAANFDIGDAMSGLSTYTSMVVLGILRHLYPLFGVSAQDPRFVFTPVTDPLLVKNYAFDQRLSDIGANPWHVLLAVASLVVLTVGVLRGAKDLRVPLVVGLALSAGFIFFSGVARWSLYEVRYAMPLLVVWSAVIAVALARLPHWITRLVLLGLVVACLPQLLNEVERPLVPPIDYHGSFLAPYFPGNQTRSGNPRASDYQTVTTMLAQSTCRRASIGNWILDEYPLWVGLQHDHWGGLLNDFDVHNQTTSLVPSYRPCASITQQEPDYVTPNNGTVNAQLGNLALSLDPGDAGTVRTPVPRFDSRVPGVGLLPGGGWTMAGYGDLPLLGPRGSLYVFSPDSRRVEIQFNLLSGGRPPTITVSGPDGPPVVADVSSHTIHAEISVHAGVNRLGLSVTGLPRGKIQLVPLRSVVLARALG